MEKIVKLWLKYYDVFLRGLCGTLWISAVTVLCGTLLGMLIALMHMGKSELPSEPVEVISDGLSENASQNLNMIS